MDQSTSRQQNLRYLKSNSESNIVAMRKDTSVLGRERPSQGIIQRRRRNDRNPNVPTCDDLHQQWTQHCKEQARAATWELHNIIYKIRRPHQENKDTFFKNKTVTGPRQESAIKKECIAHSRACLLKMSKSERPYS